ncbi:hypothetical protein GCM10010300_68270 [Streptomyces olivaceoviridis]|uniref:hypothetical protein n=1 Tax=Streptomyces olivaceoviridis TaxID=1921 RepID=UPI00167846F9|nr:hypothetical protein [Streptomyces olivaceoviridis]GGZ14506.1 hypothetical protein GCM10010300_68270 [Streptomyces olivaceoviridis]
MSAVTVARAQGLFRLVGGGRPLLRMRGSEWVFGPKTDVTGPAPESLEQPGRPAAWWRCGRPRCAKPGGKPRAGVRSAPRPR